jgi:hypothetical protein
MLLYVILKYQAVDDITILESSSGYISNSRSKILE